MRTKWTVLAYFGGEKDLAEAMVLSLKEMYRVGPGSQCNVVVQFNPVDSAPQRFTIGGVVGDASLCGLGKVVSARRLPQTDLVDIRPPHTQINRAALESFVVSGIRENLSDHYLLILGGHASGVVGRRIGEDGFSPGAMRTLDLGPMFRSIKKKTGRVVDVLGMDACFMSMCELCWELRGAVRFLVASQGLTPQYGWPYHRILELFRDADRLAPEDVASAMVGKYLRYRADFDLAGQSVDLSACEIDRTKRLADAVARLSHAMETRLNDAGFRDALVLSHWKVQAYKSEQYVDLWDFCDLLQRHSDDEAVRSACHSVKDAISDPRRGMVKKSIFNGPAYQHSHGLSIYFPWCVVSPTYAKFGFAKATRWQRFLMKYVMATRREMRGEKRRTAC
ncbi:MAG TPA: clostripain-related cysteine peptidase [Vicinamibacteria bacterium]|nr:clostripain-related cysteine peptidase [Vicinamibacteria bacterium]